MKIGFKLHVYAVVGMTTEEDFSRISCRSPLNSIPQNFVLAEKELPLQDKRRVSDYGLSQSEKRYHQKGLQMLEGSNAEYVQTLRGTLEGTFNQEFPWGTDSAFLFGLHMSLKNKSDGEHTPMEEVANSLVSVATLAQNREVVSVMRDFSLLDEPGMEEKEAETRDAVLILSIEFGVPEGEKLPVLQFQDSPYSLTAKNLPFLRDMIEREGEYGLTMWWNTFLQDEFGMPEDKKTVALLSEVDRVYASKVPWIAPFLVNMYADMGKRPKPYMRAVIKYLDDGRRSIGYSTARLRKELEATFSRVRGGRFGREDHDLLLMIGRACTQLANGLWYQADLSEFRGKPLIVERFGNTLADKGDDCEGLNALALSIFWFLRNQMQTDNPILLLVQRLCRCYVPFLCLMSCVGDSMDNADEDALPKLEDTQDAVGAHMNAFAIPVDYFYSMLRRLYRNMKEIPQYLLAEGTDLEEAVQMSKHLPTLALEGTGPMNPMFHPPDSLLGQQEGRQLGYARHVCRMRIANPSKSRQFDEGTLPANVSVNFPDWFFALREHRYQKKRGDLVHRGDIQNGFYRILVTGMFPARCSAESGEPVYETQSGQRYCFRQFDFISRRDLQGNKGVFRGVTLHDLMEKSEDVSVVLTPLPSPAVDAFWEHASQYVAPNIPVDLPTPSPTFSTQLARLDAALRRAAEESLAVKSGKCKEEVYKKDGHEIMHYFLRFQNAGDHTLQAAFKSLTANPYVDEFSVHVTPLWEDVAQVTFNISVSYE